MVFNQSWNLRRNHAPEIVRYVDRGIRGTRGDDIMISNIGKIIVLDRVTRVAIDCKLRIENVVLYIIGRAWIQNYGCLNYVVSGI